MLSELRWHEVKLEQPGCGKLLGVWLDKVYNYLCESKKANAIGSSLSTIKQ